MGLKELLQHLKESCIISLTYQGKPMGFRVKKFDPQKEDFDYYDFTLDSLKESNGFTNKEIQNYINSNYRSFTNQELILSDGLLKTQDEISSGIVVKEFKDASFAADILSATIDAMTCNIEVTEVK